MFFMPLIRKERHCDKGPRYPMLIDGNGREANSKQWVESEYPFTHKVWARVPRGGADDAADAVSAASRALEAPSWGGLSLALAVSYCTG